MMGKPRTPKLTLQAIMDLGRARVAVDKMLKLIQSED